jgi:hypothetical protein
MKVYSSRMTTTKRAQVGSAGGIVFLAVVFGLIWWQWDRIEGLFNIGGGGAVAEVYGFNCVSAVCRVDAHGGQGPQRVRCAGLLQGPGRHHRHLEPPIDTREIGIRPSPSRPTAR